MLLDEQVAEVSYGPNPFLCSGRIPEFIKNAEGVCNDELGLQSVSWQCRGGPMCPPQHLHVSSLNKKRRRYVLCLLLI